jgi:ribulose kinase
MGRQFLREIGLGELVSSGYVQIGAGSGVLLTAGEPVGQGLTKIAAEELGLVEGTPVGSGVIDAYGCTRGERCEDC